MEKYLIDTNTAIDYLDNKLPDAIIAATAINHNLILITRNVADFKKITRLKVLNPYD